MTGVQTCALPICFPVTIGGLSKVCNASYREWKKTGKKFTARVVEGGVRVWRVE